MIQTYDKGDMVRFTATFRDLAGALADPAVIVFKIRNGSGAVVQKTLAAAEVTRASLGVFYADHLLDATGDWFYRFEASGNLVGAFEGRLLVKASQF